MVTENVFGGNALRQFVNCALYSYGKEGTDSICIAKAFSHVQFLLNVLETVSAVNERLARLQTIEILSVCQTTDDNTAESVPQMTQKRCDCE